MSSNGLISCADAVGPAGIVPPATKGIAANRLKLVMARAPAAIQAFLRMGSSIPLPTGLSEAMARIPTCRRDAGLEQSLWPILDCPADFLEIFPLRYNSTARRGPRYFRSPISLPASNRRRFGEGRQSRNVSARPNWRGHDEACPAGRGDRAAATGGMEADRAGAGRPSRPAAELRRDPRRHPGGCPLHRPIL